MPLVLGKDFKEELGHIPRKNFKDDITFTPVGANPRYDKMREMNMKLIDEGFGDMLHMPNKPDYHEGLWVSPCSGNHSEWGEACIGLGFDHYENYYLKVKPDDDCRILILETRVDYIEFESKYDMQWDLMGKDFDMLYVGSYDVMNSVMSMFMTEFDASLKPKYHLMMYGWDCISGVFLNEKFTIGERVNYETSDSVSI